MILVTYVVGYAALGGMLAYMGSPVTTGVYWAVMLGAFGIHLLAAVFIRHQNFTGKHHD